VLCITLLLITIYVDVHHFTLTRFDILSRGGFRTLSSTHVVTRLGCPPSLTQGTYFSRYFTSPYIQCAIYRAHAKTPRPITCVSFGDNGSGTEVWGVAVNKIISVTGLEHNRKYHTLMDKRLTTRFDPTVALTSGTQWRPLVRSTCLGDTVTSLWTMILSRLIPMFCLCISSTEVYVQERKPIC